MGHFSAMDRNKLLAIRQPGNSKQLYSEKPDEKQLHSTIYIKFYKTLTNKQKQSRPGAAWGQGRGQVFKGQEGPGVTEALMALIV